MEMIAPSGKFWIAMPKDSASAPPAVICADPFKRPAYTTPTAIPSGMLCSVTASTIIVVRASRLFGPSAMPARRCRCGITWSSSSRKPMPHQKPQKAGKNASRSRAADCCMAGISRLHTEAATITPAAKPLSARCTGRLRSFFIKNTQHAPALVPRNGIKSPSSTSFIFGGTSLSFHRARLSWKQTYSPWRRSLP